MKEKAHVCMIHHPVRKIPKEGNNEEAPFAQNDLCDKAVNICRDRNEGVEAFNKTLTKRRIVREEQRGMIGIAKEKEPEQEKQQEEGNIVDSVPVAAPPSPDKGIRCAVRNRTSRLLWLHEFFRVYENAHTKHKFPYIYVQFRVGAHLPEGLFDQMTEAMLREIWVLGVCYIPVKHVRKFSQRVKGYMFHQELNDDDSDQALYGGCPEVVRLDNCLKWHSMGSVSIDVPRVVHADDVKNRRVHVAGRGMHFVCGVMAIEDLHCQEFRLSRLPRRHFFMYPEHRSGLTLNSASMMWEHIDGVFSHIRQCMRSARHGTSSGTFKMPFTVAAYEFWKVGEI
jgi:hypothetical protein